MHVKNRLNTTIIYLHVAGNLSALPSNEQLRRIHIFRLGFSIKQTEVYFLVQFFWLNYYRRRNIQNNIHLFQTLLLISIIWLSVYFQAWFKVLLFIYKLLRGIRPGYLRECLSPIVQPIQSMPSIRIRELYLLCSSMISGMSFPPRFKQPPILLMFHPESLGVWLHIHFNSNKIQSMYLAVCVTNHNNDSIGGQKRQILYGHMADCTTNQNIVSWFMDDIYFRWFSC